MTSELDFILSKKWRYKAEKRTLWKLVSGGDDVFLLLIFWSSFALKSNERVKFVDE
jgi:hypothetical protein